MKKQHIILAGAFLLTSLGISPLYGATPDNDPELISIKTEIDRNMKGLHITNMASPCFIDFRMTDLSQLSIVATRGELISSDEGRYRTGLPTVLAGDYANTNLNLVSNYRDVYSYENSPIGVAFGTNDAVLRTAIWKVLDDRYKNAAERFSNKQGLMNQMEIPEEERNIPDFQKMTAIEHILPILPLVYDRKAIEEYIMKASAVFRDYKELNESSVRLYAGSADVRYCNSEGSICRYPNNMVLIFINTRSQSADGQELGQRRYFVYNSLEDLPTLATLQAICRDEAELMKRKLTAPMIKEPYVGPVLFEGEAVADLINKYMTDPMKGILAKRKPIATNEMREYYSSHPALNESELESMLNKKVISRDLTLTSLTGTPEYKGQKLVGHYQVDAQGIMPAKELVLIEDGVLRNMLTSRTPTRLFRESNGHARSSINGGNMTILPGVLQLSSKNVQSADVMRKKLIAAAKEEDYEYAYIVRKIDNDTPTELIRLNVKDGSEELVRGAVIKDMALRAFKRISAISNKENLYNRVQNDVKSTYIVPSAMLFDEVDIIKDAKLVLKKNYVVDKP